MAKSWKCPRCSTANDASNVTCSQCGLLQGAVFVPTTWAAAPPGAAPPPAAPDGAPQPTPPDAAPPPLETPASGWHVPQPLAERPPHPPDDEPAAGDAQAASDSPSADDAAAGAETAPPFSDWIPVGANQPQVPAAPVPLWRRIPIGLVVFVILFAGGGLSSWFFGADRAETGEIAKPGDLTAVDLRVGDCFDLKDPQAEQIDDVAARPCAQPHEFELFFTGSLPEGPFPAQSVFDEFMNTNCMPAFSAYVGKPYEDSELDVYWLAPSVEGWGQGDRSVQCAVFHPRIHQLTESLKGSAQ